MILGKLIKAKMMGTGKQLFSHPFRRTVQKLLSTLVRQVRTEPSSMIMTPEAINSEWRLTLL